MAQTVLVADDSPTIQNKAKGILKGEGLDVVTVSNGVAAIKKLPLVKPSLILADVSMPGRDGYEVCDFVKKSPDFRHVPVVLIFSDADPYNAEQGARVGADGKIRKMAAGKPLDADELIATVKEFLAHAQIAAVSTTAASPEPAVVTEPVDEEPHYPPKKTFQLEGLEKEVAFAESGFDTPPRVTQEPLPSSVEVNFGENPTAALELFRAHPDDAKTAAVPPVVSGSAAADAPPAASLEAQSQFAPPAEPEPAFAQGTPTETPAFEAFTSKPPSEQMVVEESAPPPSPSDVPAEEASGFRIPPDVSEPIYTEELPAPPPEPISEPYGERTMAFRMPTEIAQPVLSDELASSPPAEAPHVSEQAAAEPAEASTLESFSMTEATAGQVRFTSPESESPAAPEPAGPSPRILPADNASEAEAVAAAAPLMTVDSGLIQYIVHRTVARMSSPALSQEVVDELAKRLTDEIILEFGGDPSQRE